MRWTEGAVHVGMLCAGHAGRHWDVVGDAGRVDHSGLCADRGAGMSDMGAEMKEDAEIGRLVREMLAKDGVLRIEDCGLAPRYEVSGLRADLIEPSYGAADTLLDALRKAKGVSDD